MLKFKLIMNKLSKPTKQDIQSIKSSTVLESLWDSEFSGTYKLNDLSNNTKKYFTTVNSKFNKSTLLDNGCGTGRVKQFFEGKGWNCYGSDITREGLKVASKLCPINLLHAPAHDLPFKDNFFDVVIFWRVLHNIAKKVRKASVRESARVLKQGGTLICCVQSKEDKSTLEKYTDNGVELDNDPNTYVVNQKIGKEIMPYMKHFYSLDDIKNEIGTNTGLEIISIKEIEEKSGLEAVNRKIQKYWIVEAKKIHPAIQIRTKL